MTPETRARAIELVAAGATLHEAAAACGVSHETVRTWTKDVDRPRRPRASRPPVEPIAPGERKPFFFPDGRRLGRAALWT
ncbi:helix-turn-helix domain-containing protein [Methylocystis sp.]|uniref:helix-turn-helix domain-containing protein n=1 Tax=Methylocystis sp. TaxID=1911079 RepID=UPI003D14607D